MRHFPEALALVFIGFFVSPVLAEDAAREIIERAIKARSEKPELFEKQRCEIITLQGKIFKKMLEETLEIPTTAEIKVEWPSSFRWRNDMTEKDARKYFIWCVNVDKGWIEGTDAPATEANIIGVEECKMEIYGRWLATLLPLKDKAFTLVTLKDSKVGNEDVAVIKATMRFRPDAYLSFSKKSGQLLKIAHKARENGAEFRKEHVYSDFKDFDGLTLPAKMTDWQQFGAQPAIKLAEWTITGYKFPDKFPADTFTMPKKK